ncbi:MAG TPA: hypothetical protein EYG38_13660, partial [Verrucomicrobia bacterium]|nr:hypothetical protein [Verrucomicrobiota bacterium]
DGSLKWDFATTAAVFSSPAIDSSGTLYFGSKDGNLYGVSSEGELVFSFEAGSEIFSSPTVDEDGNTFFGTIGGVFYSLSSRGKILWQFEVDGNRSIFSSPARDSEGNLYFGAYDTNVYSLTERGDLRWKFQTNGLIFGSPAVADNGNVYIASQDGIIYAIDQEGDELWRFQSDGQIQSSPAISIDGTVYIGSRDRRMYALNPLDGSIKWSFEADAPVVASPTLSNSGTLYFGTLNGKVYALDVGLGPQSRNWPMFGQNPVHTSTIGSDIGDPGLVLAITQQPDAQTIIVGDDLNLTVSAVGIGPLLFQWKVDGTPIEGATNPFLTIVNAQERHSGRYSVVISNNIDPTITSDEVTIRVIPLPGDRIIKFGTPFGTGPIRSFFSIAPNTPDEENGPNPLRMGRLRLPIILDGDGNESAFSFNININTNFFRTSFVDLAQRIQLGTVLRDARAQISVAELVPANPNEQMFSIAASFPITDEIGLPLDEFPSLPQGESIILELDLDYFQKQPGVPQPAQIFFARNLEGQIRFSEEFVPLILASSEGDNLPVNFSSEPIRVPIEGDVFDDPDRPSFVSVIDWTRIGRLVAGLDAIPTGLLFDKADCDPIDTLGNNIIELEDWQQAGKFVTAENLIVVAGSPDTIEDPLPPPPPPPPAPDEIAGSTLPKAQRQGTSEPSTILSIGQVTALPGSTVTIPIRISASGDEAALSFSLNFNPNLLKYVQTRIQNNVDGTFFVNNKQVSKGQVGIVYSAGISSRMKAGNYTLFETTFQTLSGQEAGSIEFSDQVVQRKILNTDIKQMKSSFIGGDVILTPGTPVKVVRSGFNNQKQFEIRFATEPGAGYLIESSKDLIHWEIEQWIYPVTDAYQYADPKSTNLNQQFYRVNEFGANQNN